MLRRARRSDAAALARIYNQAMQPGIFATAQVEPVSADSRIAWLDEHPEPFGVWVHETKDGTVVGWCSLSPFPVRPRYPGIAEVSVYVDQEHRGHRVGALLMACLVKVARARGFRSLVSIAFARNTKSIGGSLAAGFRWMGKLPQAGAIAGGHEDVAWVHKDLRVEDPPLLRMFVEGLEIDDAAAQDSP